MKRWPPLVRVLAVLALLLLGLAAAGATYQAIGVARDRRAFPPPGRLVDVGGYRMHLDCAGSGSPTVVLDTLSAGTSPLWAWVREGVVTSTRVCAYDRAGWGWSDDGPEPRDAQRAVDELHALLENGGERAPFVLVGHSLGGLYVRLYAARHPEQVVGLVLVDASHPDQARRLPAEELQGARSFERLLPTFSVLERLGLFRLYFALGGELDMGTLPAAQRAQATSFWSLPRHWDAQRREGEDRARTDAQVRQASRSLGSLPLAVVTAGEGSTGAWLEMQRDLATLSRDGGQLVVPGATHASLVLDPDHARRTADAILAVVEAVRGERPLVLTGGEPDE